MKTPRHFLTFCGVFNISMLIAVLTYQLMGFCGYWRYGPKTADSITLNIPGKEIAARICMLLYAVAIYVSYGLQCFVAVDVLWNIYLADCCRSASKGLTIFYQYLMRILIVVLTTALAASVPFLGLFISFIGALCMASLQFFFPCLMDFCIRWPNDYGRFKWIIVRDFFFMIFGVLCVLIGCGVSLREIVIAVTKK